MIGVGGAIFGTCDNMDLPEIPAFKIYMVELVNHLHYNNIFIVLGRER